MAEDEGTKLRTAPEQEKAGSLGGLKGPNLARCSGSWLILTVLASTLAGTPASTQERDQIAEQEIYYKLESLAREHYENLAHANEKFEQKSNTLDDVKRLKFIQYNYASIRARCIVREASSKEIKNLTAHELVDRAQSCIMALRDDMVIVTQILADYGDVIGQHKILQCEMKARQFERERLLKPYDFLRSDGPTPGFSFGLYDFDAFKKCLLQFTR